MAALGLYHCRRNVRDRATSAAVEYVYVSLCFLGLLVVVLSESNVVRVLLRNTLDHEHETHPEVTDHLTVVGVERLVDEREFLTSKTTLDAQQMRELNTDRQTLLYKPVGDDRGSPVRSITLNCTGLSKAPPVEHLEKQM